MKQSLQQSLALLAVWLGGVSVWALVEAAPPAGTIIKNQASASYTDSTGVVRIATSNVVETTIQQVAAMQLDQNQNKPAAAGQQIFFSHTVTNNGNGADSFVVVASNDNTGDDFDLGNLQIYNDTNQDGQPDTYSPVAVSPLLASQQSWHFVVAGNVPASITASQMSAVTVTATSQMTVSVTATNSDTVTVTDAAVIEVTKNLSSTTGSSPFGPFTVTLSYRNTGSAAATDVTLIDALPAGMVYVAGSARWNETGTTVLTDANPADPQGSGETLQYCAYDVSCIGIAEANYDTDSDSSNQVTAIVSSVAPGDLGQVTFEVQIATDLPVGNLLNTAEFEYSSTVAVSPRYDSNTVTFQVLHTTDVVLNGSATVATEGTAEPSVIAAAPQGVPVSFVNYVWNTGNGSDTFDISLDSIAATFPAGSLFRVLQSDGMTPLIDSSGNGIPDTGPLAADAFYKVVVQVIPPSDVEGDNGGAGYSITATATAVSNSSASNTMINRLLLLSAASVDITNVAQVSEPAATGVGTGPETDAVTTLTASPGTTLTLPLFINNTGATATSFDLSVSTLEDFSEIALPEGWQVVFKESGEDPLLTNTGVINAGGFFAVDALITLPVNSPAATTSLYFRAWSQATGALDSKHDAIEVVALQQVLLEMNQAGQLDPGGTYTYSHLITNTGNTEITSIALATNDNQSAAGWASTIYEDTDADGELGAADVAITGLAALAVGEAKQLFVKVYAPSSAELLSVNTTGVVASWNSGADQAVVSDVTTVTSSEINIVKEQAPDFGCNGVLDAPYSVAGFAVEPGNNCVSYRLTAVNAGLVTVYNVEVADATPAFTEYFGAASCSMGACTVVEPSPGAQGNVIASLSSLAAGGSLVLEFSVRVE